MKKVLSLLLAYVFLQVQTWALSGGPDYSQGSDDDNPQRFVGSYAGVLVPEETVNAGFVDAAVIGLPTSSALGVFTLGIPTTGLASGAALLFVDGVAFNSEMSGVLDPDKSRLDAILSGTSNFEIIRQVLDDTTTTIDPVTGAITVVQSFTEESSPVLAQGTVTAKIKEGDVDIFTGEPSSTTTTGFFTQTTTTTDVGASTAARITGSASIDVFSQVNAATGAPIISSTTNFQVDGFKQTNEFITVTTDFDFFF